MRVMYLVGGPIPTEQSLLMDAKNECLRQMADGHTEPEQMLMLAKAYRALREAESNE